MTEDTYIDLLAKREAIRRLYGNIRDENGKVISQIEGVINDLKADYNSKMEEVIQSTVNNNRIKVVDKGDRVSFTLKKDVEFTIIKEL